MFKKILIILFILVSIFSIYSIPTPINDCLVINSSFVFDDPTDRTITINETINENTTFPSCFGENTPIHNITFDCQNNIINLDDSNGFYFLNGGHNITIKNCNFNLNGNNGIINGVYSNNMLIENNTFFNGSFGIDLNGHLSAIYNITIRNNIFNKTNNAIYFLREIYNSKIYNNSFYNSTFRNIYLGEVTGEYPNNSLIYNNIFEAPSKILVNNGINNFSYLGQGNYYQDLEGLSGEICYDSPTNNSCDSLPQLYIAPTIENSQNQVQSTFPSMNIVSLFLIIFSLIIFFN